MAKVKTNSTIGPMTGKIKDMHFAVYGDKQVARGGYVRKPTTEWTESQVQSQGKFGKATEYAKDVLADPAKKRQYHELSKAKHRSEWNLAIADARRPPVILDVNLSQYCGRPGNKILIAAADDTKVDGVSLLIQTAAAARSSRDLPRSTRTAAFGSTSRKWPLRKESRRWPLKSPRSISREIGSKSRWIGFSGAAEE